MKNFILYKQLVLSMLLALIVTAVGAQGTNIALNGTFSHSGGGSGTYGPANYNDAVIQVGTFGWVSGSGGPNMWIQCVWSSPQTFDKITVWPDNTANRFLASGDIEIWNGSSWTNHASFVSPSTRPFDIGFAPATTTRMRFINMTVTGSQSSNPSVNEIQIFEAILAANNAAVLDIDSPSVFCEGTHNIVATIQNRGINQIDSVRVNWSFNGTIQPTINYTSLLDTIKGTGASSAQIVLGSEMFTSGQTDSIAVWTSMPNGVADTFNLDDTARSNVQPAIFGNFTINATGTGATNYVSFMDAATDLSDFGVCGPVTYTVAPGTYTEQFELGEIQGASDINTISFNPDTGGIVTVEFNPTFSDNFVLKMSGADYVSFTDIVFQVGSSTSSYARVLEMNGGSSHNSFTNCEFNGYTNATTSDRQAVIYSRSSDNSYNKFYNNMINNGSYGVYFFGGSTSSPNEANEWVGNAFNDAYYRGLYLYYNRDMIFNYNTMETNTTYQYGYGFMSYYSYNASEVIGNHLSWPGYCAMYLYQYNGTANEFPVIANNMVNSGNGQYYHYGTYIYGGFAKIVHNSIVKNSSATYGYYGMYVAGGGNTVLNNIIYDPQGSSSYYTMYYNGGFAVLESDYNDIYSGGSQSFGRLNATFSTFEDWKTGTGFDTNSVITDPGFVNYDSLRTCNDTLDGAGTPISYVTDDYDGDSRDPLTPDIGADEFVGNAPGSYSAGPDAIVCDGKTVEIGLQVTGGSFLWSNSDTTSTIVVSSADIYIVTMSSDCGGSFVDTVVVTDVTPTASFTTGVVYVTGVFTNNSVNGDNYRWVVQKTPFDTIWSTDLTYVFPDVGPYQVCLTTFNDCDTVETCTIWEGYVPIGIEENSLSDMISLMPNPVSDDLTVQFQGMESNEVNVEMTNVQGQVVYNSLFDNVSGNTSETIDVSALKKGMYIVKFTTEKEVSAKRIIVQ